MQISMVLIFCGTALAVAIAALWFAGNVVRQAAGKNEELIRTQLERYEAEVEEMSKSVRKTAEKVESMDQAIKARTEEHEKDMKNMMIFIDKIGH